MHLLKFLKFKLTRLRDRVLGRNLTGEPVLHLPFDPSLPSPKPSEEDQMKVINVAVTEASKILLTAMFWAQVPHKIYGTVYTDTDAYELTFVRKSSPHSPVSPHGNNASA